MVKAFDDLRKLKLRLKADIEISRAGSHFKARWRGCSNFTFGSTPEEAEERLRQTSAHAYRNNGSNLRDRANKVVMERKLN